LKMIPVDFQHQVLPGSFEFALCHLVDKELDLSALRSRFRNDAGGAPAFDPAAGETGVRNRGQTPEKPGNREPGNQGQTPVSSGGGRA